MDVDLKNRDKLYKYYNSKMPKKYKKGHKLTSGAYGKIFNIKPYSSKLVLKIIYLNNIIDSSGSGSGDDDEDDVTKYDIMYDYQLKEICALRALTGVPYQIPLYHLNVIRKNEVHMYFPKMDDTLTSYIFGDYELTNNQRAFIIYQLLDAVRYMKNLNIIHRDIKPENIGINSDYRICLLDYGLCYYGHIDQDLCTRVQTLGWRAPELLNDNKIYDYKADLWSIGIIILELYLQNGFLIDVDEDVDEDRNEDDNSTYQSPTDMDMTASISNWSMLTTWTTGHILKSKYNEYSFLRQVQSADARLELNNINKSIADVVRIRDNSNSNSSNSNMTSLNSSGGENRQQVLKNLYDLFGHSGDEKRNRLAELLSGNGNGNRDSLIDLVNKLLTYDPTERITVEEALEHNYFTEHNITANSSSSLNEEALDYEQPKLVIKGKRRLDLVTNIRKITNKLSLHPKINFLAILLADLYLSKSNLNLNLKLKIDINLLSHVVIDIADKVLTEDPKPSPINNYIDQNSNSKLETVLKKYEKLWYDILESINYDCIRATEYDFIKNDQIEQALDILATDKARDRPKNKILID